MAHRRGLVVCVLLALVVMSAPAAAQPPSLADRLRLDPQALADARAARTARFAAGRDVPTVPGSLLVTVTPGAAEPLRTAALSVAGAAQQVAAQVVHVRVAEGAEAAVAAELAAQPGVVAVEPDLRLSLARAPDDPDYPEQFAHQLTGIERAWDTTTGDRAVTVGVIDSGMVADHPDLAGLVVDQVRATADGVTESGPDNDSCRIGHGTWVAGIIGALGDNGMDVAGVTYGVSFVDVDVADAEACEAGAVTLSGVLAGLDHVTAAGVDLVNLSLGGIARSCPTALQTTLDATRAAGIPVIAAAGNAGPGTTGIPGSCDGVISVGAVGAGGAPASYSSANPYVDLTAPGGDDADTDGEITPAEGVLSTSWWSFGERTPSVVPLTGTSFSAPYVTGVAALLLAADPDLTPDELEYLLEATAADRGAPGRDPETGFGLVDPTAALALAAEGEIPPPASDPGFPVGSPAGVRPGGDVELLRVAAGTGTTEPIPQAVAVSRAVFPEELEAQYAVLARGDDFADALAGSALTLGVAPLLFTGSSGGLAEPTAAELSRVLPPGAGVLVLGGEQAIPGQVDEDLRALGYDPIRLAGAVREETAVAAADALRDLTAELGFEPPAAILASRSVWYDAITAGSLSAGLAAPVLLTPAASLHPATAAALESLDAATLYVVGGEVRIPAAVRQQARDVTAQAETVVLAGPTRDATAVAVAAELERLAGEQDVPPFAAVGINLTRDDGYAHALSVSPLLALLPTVFVPLLGEDGGEFTPATVGHFRGIALPTVVAGDTDLVSADAATALKDLIETAP